MSQATAVLPDPSFSVLSADVLKATAKAAKLRYVSDRSRGIRRERTGDHFGHFDAHGVKITDEEEVTRIRKLAIPPAYEDVWICPFTNGHLLATGRDTRGRKQYRYHPRWRAVRDEGQRHTVGSDDVNEYLRDITGEEITAKDFRTWAATNLAALALQRLEAFDSQAKAKKNVLQAVEAVAKMLGNTPPICRKCYLHPAIFNAYLDGTLLETLKQRSGRKAR